jgi:hypothetical protein
MDIITLSIYARTLKVDFYYGTASLSTQTFPLQILCGGGLACIAISSMGLDPTEPYERIAPRLTWSALMNFSELAGKGRLDRTTSSGDIPFGSLKEPRMLDDDRSFRWWQGK